MSELSGKTAFVIDNGLFVHVAQRLARDYGRVLYYTGWENAFSGNNDVGVGVGMENVERVNRIFEHLDEADTFVFPDLHWADLQAHLRSLGKNVWGMGEAEWFERERYKSRELTKELGLPTTDFEEIIGVDALKEFLSEHDGETWYVKLIGYREFETFAFKGMKVSEYRFDEIAHTLGAMKNKACFMVEKKIEGVEVGYDGFTIDGQYPETAEYGYEIKDEGFIGCFKPYSQMPKPILEVNEAIAGLFEHCKSRSQFSTEIRWGQEKKPYLIDPCLRCGSPPGELIVESITNFPEIVYEGAQGNMVQPIIKAKYGAIAMIHCTRADHEVVTIEVPKKYENYVKLKCAMVDDDGRTCIIPQDIGLTQIGAVVGMGQTVLEAVNNVKKVAEEVKGDEIDIKIEALNEAQETIKEGVKYGIQF